MKIDIFLPIKSPQDLLIDEARSYLKKLRPGLSSEIFFVPPKKEAPDPLTRKKRESEELLLKSSGYFRIALCEGGTRLSSKAFAKRLENLKNVKPKLAFLIGGAYGHDDALLPQCDELISLSDMTMAHRLALLVLCEQLYRASEIMAGSPYHK